MKKLERLGVINMSSGRNVVPVYEHELDALEREHERANELIRHWYARSGHPDKCICTACEDSRAYLA